METRKIIRSNGSGVWFGEIKERDGDRFTLTNARRLWYWEGLEVLTVSDEAAKNIDEVWIWGLTKK